MAATTDQAYAEGNYNWGADTIAEALGLGRHAIKALEPYSLGDEQVVAGRPTRRVLTGPRFTADDLDRLLEPLEEDIAAGVPDALLAKRTGVPVHTVARWRRRRGTRRRPGRPSNRERIRHRAVEIFGGDPRPVCMLVESSRVAGKWEPPEYLMRQLLDYGAFSEAMKVLLDEGMEPGRIARGLGVREEDVRLGAAVAGGC